MLLTHLARKRAEAPIRTEDRAAWVREMKQRMPCAGVLAHGHWHKDESCPQRSKQQKTGGPTFIVSQDCPEESDSEDAFFTGLCGHEDAHEAVLMATGGRPRGSSGNFALADTCCVRTVCGVRWPEDHAAKPNERSAPFLTVEDRQPFRLGDGPKIFR